MNHYQIINYDVWGNTREGFTVNQAFTTNVSIQLSDNYTNKELKNALYKSGFFNVGITRSKLEIDNQDSCIYINHVSKKVGYYPLLELRLIAA